MKNKKNLLVVFVLAAFCIMGCVTAKKPVPARYSFAGNEGYIQTAAINFISETKTGVRLVDCNGNAIPSPDQGTYWESVILFPAYEPLDLRVFIYWNKDQYGERRRGIFKCPPLEAGREYKLWFNGNLKGGSIILTYSNVTELRFASGKPQFEVVHEQVLPPPPK
jgi:hypothetical protein